MYPGVGGVVGGVGLAGVGVGGVGVGGGAVSCHDNRVLYNLLLHSAMVSYCSFLCLMLLLLLTLQHQLPGEEMRTERGARRSALKGQEEAIVRQTGIGTVSKAALGETGKTRWSAYGFLKGEDTILN